MADPFQSQLPIKPDQILEIIFRRKWFIILPLCLTLTFGLYHTLTASKTYEASTLILVQPQRVPTQFVQSIVTTSISQRISTISQQILSRTNLEKIIDQFGLFENAQDMYLEDKIASMRARVRVKIERARHGAEAFSIGFKGSDPQRVMRVANTLASYFMDENLKVREAQAVGTSEFLQSELEKTRKELEARETQLSNYKRQYFGGLPSELETNLNTLNRLQSQLTDKNNMLRDAQNELNLLNTQIAQSKEMGSQNLDDQFSSFDFDDSVGFEASENEQKLTAVKKQYETLLLKYTDKHPDVKRLKNIIEKLEKTIEDEKKAAEEASASIEENKNDDFNAPAMPNFAVMQQELQLKQLKNEIKKIRTDIGKIENKMEIYQKRVDDTPKRELELLSLQRDYSNIQNVFNSLLDRKLAAELSVTMEKKQKGEQFRILDHARLPEKPISPNVNMLFLLSIASGLGIGAGVIFLLEFFDTSIRREEQIEDELGLTILAIIPPLKGKEKKNKKRLDIIAFVCCTLYALTFLSFFAILNYKGLDRTIYFIKSTLNM